MSPRGPGPVAVVGAGVSGAACAAELVAAGVPVRVLDRGRRPGGRLSGRALAGRVVDLGASYLTVDGEDFAQVVEAWRARGLAREWTDTFTVLTPGEPASDKAGPMRWGAPGGLRSLVEDLLGPGDPGRHEVRSVSLDPDGSLLVDGEAARAVVLAMPDPQAARLLGPGLAEVGAGLTRDWEPVLAVAARWERRTWDHVASGGIFHGAFVNDDPVLGFVADDGRRRDDRAPVVVAHTTPGFAREHLEDPAGAEPVVRMALRSLLGAPEPDETLVQRWTFARPTGQRSDPYLLSAVGDGILGVCGDGWGETSKVETAWRSGRDLARALTAELT